MSKTHLIALNLSAWFFIALPVLGQSPIFEPYPVNTISTDQGVTRGVAWGDFDGDGDPDLYTSNTSGERNVLYINDGNGNLQKSGDESFLKVLTDYPGRSEGVNWVDYDNDGDLDLYVCSRGLEANNLFQNTGDGYEMVTNHPLTADSISASMACWADYEGDGDLDVLLIGYRHQGNIFYENVGNGDFVKKANHVLSEGNGSGRTCSCGDADNDGLPEIFVGNARQPNFLYRNLGGLEFVRDTTGIYASDLGYAYGSSWSDFDQDGDLDLFIANFDKQNYLFVNNEGVLTPLENDPIAVEKGGASKGHSWGDYDNDGDLDVFIGNGTYGADMRNFLFLNDGGGKFERYHEGVLSQDADTSAGVAHADFDRDGDLDIFVANWGGDGQLNRLYQNQTQGKNWIGFRLKGTTSNSFAVGARVTITTSIGSQYRWVYPVTGYASQDDYEVHFGLGNSTSILDLKVEWPSGKIDSFQSMEINKYHQLSEGGI